MTSLTHTPRRGPRLPLWAAVLGVALLLVACNDIAAPVCTTTDFPVPDSLHIAVTIQVCR